MPLYEYRCRSCERTIEVIQSYQDKPLRKCEHCGGRLDKLVSRSGFVLKGSGWYASDYKSAPSSKGKDASKDASKDAGSGTSEAAGGASEAPSKPDSGGKGGSSKDKALASTG